jgi:hypothetical protein
MQSVYAFDQLVLPLGTQVRGHISKIGKPSGKQLTWSTLNADFSPTRIAPGINLFNSADLSRSVHFVRIARSCPPAWLPLRARPRPPARLVLPA